MLSKPPRSDESKIKSSQSVSTAGKDPSVAAGSSNMRHPIGEQHDERHPSRPMPASCLPPAATKERAYHRCLGSVARTCTTAASCQPRGSAASYRRRAMRLNVSTPTTDRDEARRASTRQAPTSVSGGSRYSKDRCSQRRAARSYRLGSVAARYRPRCSTRAMAVGVEARRRPLHAGVVFSGRSVLDRVL